MVERMKKFTNLISNIQHELDQCGVVGEVRNTKGGFYYD